MRKILLSAILLLGFAGTANANTFVWKDDVNGYTFSFPDTWGVQTVESPTMRIRIAGPLNEDKATCNIKTQKDGRLEIYPKHLMSEAVDETLNRDFWQTQVDALENGTITDYHAPTNLGNKGDATAIRASYVEGKGKDVVPMYAEMIGSIYGDTRYVITCSSKQEAFEKYAPLFSSIMASVNLDSRYQPFATGFYRDFLSDPKLRLPRSKPGTIDPKGSFALHFLP